MLRVVDEHNKKKKKKRLNVESSTTGVEGGCLLVDHKKKQATFRESYGDTTMENRVYTFDHVFEKHSPPEVSSAVLVDLLHSVVGGTDACLLAYGYPNLGTCYCIV